MVAQFLAGVAAPGSARQLNDGDLARRVRAYLTRLEGFGFSGAALVAKDGKVLVETAHGLADRQKKTSVRADTIFDIGSVTKQFTAAAILLLESEGKLNVTDPVSKYLKNVPEDKAGITIHHLLTHTSGLEMGFGGDYEKVSRDALVGHAMSSKLRSPPGERHAYSNAGYSLLAAIVEIVSGQSYEAFLRERLFRPAGMTSSGYFFPKEAAGRLARGYQGGEDWGVGAERAAATVGEFWNLIGNGGVHSTVGDMYRWMVALTQGKVLNREALEKLFRPHVLVYADYRNSKSPLHYAYGWYVWKQPSGKTMIFHLGGNGVFNAAVRYHLDDRALVIYASNVSEFHDPNYPVPAIERMLAGEAVGMPPQVRPLSEQQLAEYAGRYQAASGSLVSVEAKSQSLKLYGEGQEAFSFVTTGLWQKDPALEEMNARTAEVVENSRTGRYETLLKAYGLETTLEQLAEFEKLFWKKRHDRHGGYVRTRVLGTMPSRDRAFTGRTIVAIDFERGTTYREYLWTRGGKIGDVGPLLSAPSAQYFPDSAGCVVKFDAAKALVSSRVCIEKKGTGGTVATVVQGESRIELKKL
ncbi:MAG TPA: serine hydrolase domain-containing protein [Pyrinomonadaceae bacterium]|jgi:CubicO group peptidase (beta-lactamase class C family)